MMISDEVIYSRCTRLLVPEIVIIAIRFDYIRLDFLICFFRSTSQSFFYLISSYLGETWETSDTGNFGHGKLRTLTQLDAVAFNH